MVWFRTSKGPWVNDDDSSIEEARSEKATSNVEERSEQESSNVEERSEEELELLRWISKIRSSGLVPPETVTMHAPKLDRGTLQLLQMVKGLISANGSIYSNCEPYWVPYDEDDPQEPPAFRRRVPVEAHIKVRKQDLTLTFQFSDTIWYEEEEEHPTIPISHIDLYRGKEECDRTIFMTRYEYEVYLEKGMPWFDDAPLKISGKQSR
jgi:hypothetical protein